ncbi:MAG TPA: alpha-2-macroglobulin family protein [Terriglobales bacterium]|nr:alpha-2-macroglobulin family protein [Terriglobales bacterium]
MPILTVLIVMLAAGAALLLAGRQVLRSAGPRPADEPRLLSPAPLLRPGASWTGSGVDPTTPGSGQSEPSEPSGGQAAPSRKRLDQLIGEQKFEEAASEAARLREAAKRRGDDDAWAWALIKEAQLRTALHGYETAVRFLKDEAWPASPVDRDMLELFYARSLVTYYRSYSWDINQRERVEAAGPVDLKSWTRDRLFAEAWGALARVWKDRGRLADRRAGEFPDVWEPGDYPAGVRDTLRDSVVYLFARLLADTSFWTPRQSNETYLLDLDRLLAAPSDAASVAAVLDSASAHPLERIASLLAEHEAWARRARRPEAALEARLTLIETLHGAFSDDEDRALLEKRLAEFLPKYRRYAWWGMGQALLAEFISREDAPDSLIRARAAALQAAEAYPLSPGAKRCQAIVKRIEAPDIGVEAMKNDSPGRRSIRVTHRNLERVFFRAYAFDLLGSIKSAKDYNLLPGQKEAEAVIRDGKPVAAWQAVLPRTPDYRDHQTYVETPAGLAPGFYIVVASPREDFARTGNRIVAVDVILSDLVLLVRDADEGGAEVLTLSGASGRPRAGASVDLYAYDWRNGHRLVLSEQTDEEGRARLAARPGSGAYFLVARRGDDLAVDNDWLRLNAAAEGRESTQALVYTDRSIYRPGQKIYWKILAYKGRRDLGKLGPAAGAAASVWLEDVNGQRVVQATAVTNAFGTASGEFLIPAAGRPLGAWRLRSTPDGYAQVRVEEYKRPTFEVTVRDPEKPLRLNRPAALMAEARYYFGLPVASGDAVWQVRREPVYPRWWWSEESGDARSQVIAGGRARVKEDGTVAVSFTPAADERKAAAGVSFRYTLSVDVTDEGGETRSARRSFRLGFVGVEATIAARTGYSLSSLEYPDFVFDITRTDLDGTPRPGRGSFRMVRLVEPEKTLLPADQPLPNDTADEAGRFRTPGDRLRPRWGSSPSPEEVLRTWKEGVEYCEGIVDHDASGRGRVDVPPPGPGAYRLLYETKDEFGAVCRESLDFLVVGGRKPASPAFKLPLVVRAEKATVRVGGKACFLVHSGLPGQPLLLETYKGGRLWERRSIDAGKDSGVLVIPVTEEMRGGFGVRVSALRDHQFMSEEASVFVPWDDKDLGVSFATFRDKLSPGAKESWRVTVKMPDGKPAVQGAAELLAYMYDRSLDLFAPHRAPRLEDIYPRLWGPGGWNAVLGLAPQAFSEDTGWARVPSYPTFRPDELLTLSEYGIGGPGGRRYGVEGGVVGGVLGGVKASMTVTAAAPVVDVKSSAKSKASDEEAAAGSARAKGGPPAQEPAAEGAAAQLRSNFSETAFWQPHLLTGADGTAAIEFTVPDSVTGWRVFVHGVTKDLAGGTLESEARTVKELMVRPYLPRFFREGDRAELRVMVNNAGEKDFAAEVALEVFDPATNENLAPAFGLPEKVPARAVTVKAGGGAAVAFPLSAPARVGTVAFKVTAKAGAFSDGELRPLPVLPGRMRLVQSRFVTLKGAGASREMKFTDMAAADDPTRINEQLVVTVDGQLFYGLLDALPYLVNYPYECTEQTLNRFLSTGILTGLYDKFPAVARMAQQLSKRETVYESFDAADPNRKMGLEETPWLVEARGGTDAGYGLEKVLDPRVAAALREASLAKLLKAQTSLGAFPWWPGGPPSPYMTLYIVHGFSKALEFGAAVPKEPVVRAFGYLHRHYLDEVVADLMARDTGWEFTSFLNYTLSNFPDASWTGGVFTEAERRTMLDFSFKHWKDHSPYLKGYLALTLKRAGQAKDAALVWDSVMDSAKTTEDEGTSWAPEDRGWLWYNDTIETHAFALRTLTELRPADARGEGLVQWLFLNKKLNHWKSTRATAEVIYSVAYFLKQTGALGVRESVTAEACGMRTTFLFEPDKYTGKKNQIVVAGGKVGPECATVRVSKEGKGMAFAGATWHFSTEKMPEKAEGDLFAVERSYFKREKRGEEVVLKPLAEGAKGPGGEAAALKPLAEGAALAVGDEVEVHLSIRARHPAEYVHLRDPRPAGCEPVTLTSGYKWDLGLVRYEEVRDSGTNFFMERVPQGEYTLVHRMRCAMAGTFRVAPATLQSMYAPEFAAYSAGALLSINRGSDLSK